MNPQATIVFNYQMLDIQKQLKVLKKHTYTSATICREYLQAVYNAMTPEEKALAKDDFELTMDMVDDSTETIEAFNLKDSDQIEMPFAFGNQKYCHWVDVVVSLPPIVPVREKKYEILYDIRKIQVTDDQEKLIERYLYSNESDFKSHIGEIFDSLSSTEQQEAVTEYITIKERLETIIDCSKLDLYEVETAQFEFKNAGGYIYKIDILVHNLNASISFMD